MKDKLLVVDVIQQASTGRQLVYLPNRHSSAVKRCATLLFFTAMPMARRLPTSTHNLRAQA